MDKEELQEELLQRGLIGDSMKNFYKRICRLEAEARMKAERCKPEDALYYIWNGKADAYSIARYELEIRIGLQK